jgi:hypothetical protein
MCSDDTASPDAIPFGKLALCGADSAALLKESPETQNPEKPKPATRAGHNFPAEAGEERSGQSHLPPNRPALTTPFVGMGKRVPAPDRHGLGATEEHPRHA